MSVRLGVAAFALGVLTCSSAMAQTHAPAGSAGNSMQEGDASLSSKLSKSGGVITPQAGVDPGIKVPAPAPNPNSTPVIPPSATGGNTAK